MIYYLSLTYCVGGLWNLELFQKQVSKTRSVHNDLIEKQLPDVLLKRFCSDVWVTGCEIGLQGLLQMVTLMRNNDIFISFQIYHILIVQQQIGKSRGSIAPPKVLGASQWSLL